MSAFVELTDVKKIYQMGEVQIKAANGINFAIEKGEFVVIVGPSGAGKTTVLNILGGMDTATSGQVMVDGVDIAGLKGKALTKYRREDIGFVFQFYNLVQNLTALETWSFPCRSVKTIWMQRQYSRRWDWQTEKTISPHSSPAVSSRECPLPEPWQKILSFCSAMSQPAHWIIRPVRLFSSCCSRPAVKKI